MLTAIANVGRAARVACRVELQSTEEAIQHETGTKFRYDLIYCSMVTDEFNDTSVCLDIGISIRIVYSTL